MKRVPQDDKEYICDIDLPCFNYLERDEIEIIRSGKTQIAFKKGENLTKQGAFSSYLLFLVKGFAVEQLEGENNKKFNLKIVTPGEFIGLSSVFDKVKYDYTTVALSDCQAFLIEKESIAGLIKKNGGFGYNITRRYCKQNSSLFGTVSALTFRQISGKLAGALLYLNDIYKSYPELNGTLTRRDIASFCGISEENCVRELKSMESSSLIKLEGKRVLILNESSLNNIKERG